MMKIVKKMDSVYYNQLQAQYDKLLAAAKKLVDNYPNIGLEELAEVVDQCEELEL